MSTSALSPRQREETRDEFRQVVNMTPAALRKWLQTEESRSVGMTSQGEKVTTQSQPEAVGHHMGQRILEICARKHDDLTDDDYHDMRKVIGYVHRHIKQRPQGDISDTRWRRALMNWGHDPLRQAG